MNLYEIRAEIISIMTRTDEDGMLPDDAFDRLAELGMAEQDKIENIGLYVKNLSAESDAIKHEVDNLTDRRTVTNNKIESLKRYLTDYLVTTGTKISTSRLLLSLRSSTAVVLDNESIIPQQYYVPQDPQFSKAEIKLDLLAGFEVPGARLETRQNVQVK